MKKLYFLILLCAIFSNLKGQQSIGGTPVSFNLPEIENENFQKINLTSPDMDKVKTEDEDRASEHKLDLISRFIDVDLNLNNSGTWVNLSNGDRLWRLTLKSKDAQALSFLYNHFHIADNSVLYIYNKDHSMVLGGYTSANNKVSNLFATGTILGDEITIELLEPISDLGANAISLNQVSYVYRNAFPEQYNAFKSAGGQSDPCQVNVACSEGDDWQDEEKGVVRILLTSNQGQGWCSGSLVNNTALDCTPYILTAWHCGEDSSPAQYNQYIYYFNYQSNSCTGSGSSGTQSITGSSRIAYSNDGGGNSGSDFLLTEITQDIPESLEAYWNGWNNVNTTSSSGVSIHHPAGDIKKISTYSSNLNSTQWGSAAGSHWRVTWIETDNGHGVTEGGSSGSPIFNANGEIIGQLTGGSSFCTAPNNPDFYGKMSYNWDSNGNQDFEQLKTFLDPTNSGVTSLAGTYAPCNDPTLSGCTDPDALNYNAEAEEDDGSCLYPCAQSAVTIDLTLDCYGSETSWAVLGENDEVLYSVPVNTYAGSEGDAEEGGSSDQIELCLPAGCYTFVIEDTYGDGMFGSQWNGCGVDGDVIITNGLNEILFDLDDPDFGTGGTVEFCLVELDLDNDGWLISEGDCDNNDAEVFPGADEICDGVDNNCDGFIDEGFIIDTYWLDADNDGYGDINFSTTSCFIPEGYVPNSTDCNDEDENINPGISEICDGIDNNCDGLTDEGFITSQYFLDSDNDGFGNPNSSVISCFMPDGYANNGDDCNDFNENINPESPEICNNADDNCSGEIDEGLITQTYYADTDNDNYGDPDNTIENCSQPNGYVQNNLDCDDTDDDINPAADEILDDGIDQDCDGQDLMTGISESSVGKVLLFPNPISHELNITNVNSAFKLEILDLAGRLILVKNFDLTADISVDLSGLSTGQYLARVTAEKHVTIKKIMKE